MNVKIRRGKKKSLNGNRFSFAQRILSFVDVFVLPPPSLRLFFTRKCHALRPIFYLVYSFFIAKHSEISWNDIASTRNDFGSLFLLAHSISICSRLIHFTQRRRRRRLSPMKMRICLTFYSETDRMCLAQIPLQFYIASCRQTLFLLCVLFSSPCLASHPCSPHVFGV